MDTNIIDERVYNAIVLLSGINKKPSIRQIAKILGKEKSLRTVQLSIERLMVERRIFRNDKGIIEINYDI